MAKAKAKAKAKAPSRPTVEELYFRSDSAYLCLILNNRTKFVRVIDFRAGALPAKRLYIQSVGKKEGIKKVITLVEKDEVSSWVKVGFTREGTIPGFYKRSDGHLCGCVIGDDENATVSDAGVRLAERTINRAKKVIKDYPAKVKGAQAVQVDEDEALKAREEVWNGDAGLHTFDTFGRDARRAYYKLSYKKTEPNYLSAEYQDCFGHSLIEILRRPADENERKAVLNGLRVLGEWLTERGIVSGFLFIPSDDEELAGMLLAAGYRKTGLLAGCLEVGNERKDAILWTRKFANPAEDG
ncbi:MAG: hypothetical protein AB8H86_23985 [Polyangiales bacterium]